MEIDTEKLKAAIRDAIEKFKALEMEVLAYRFIIHCAQESGLVDPVIPWDKALENAKQNPVFVKHLADKYDSLAVEIAKAIDQTELSQERFAKLLLQWKPSDLPN